MTEVSLLSLAFAILGGCYGMFGASCPRCRSRLVWKAMSERGIGNWLSWLRRLQQCPTCDYRP
jgi:DNA-directed RNA polymerase subunit RPC12/RpoP